MSKGKLAVLLHHSNNTVNLPLLIYFFKKEEITRLTDLSKSHF